MITGLGVTSTKGILTESITLILSKGTRRREDPPIWKDLMKQCISMQYDEILMLTGVMLLTKRRVINCKVIDLYLIQDTTS
jgi:hypothetical protein